MTQHQEIIEVNSVHQVLGSQGDATNCALALALTDAGYHDVEVYVDHSRIDGVIYRHSEGTSQQLRFFDQNGRMEHEPQGFAFDHEAYKVWLAD